MKYLSILLISLSLMTSYANAKEKETKQDDEKQSIEELIKEIKSNPSNRRLAINRLKIQLRNINTDIRRKIMLDLQHSLGGHTVQTTNTSSGHIHSQSGTTQQQPPTSPSTPTTNTPASIPNSSPVSAPTPASIPASIPASVPTPASLPAMIPASIPTPASIPSMIPASVPTPASIPAMIPVSVPTPTSAPASLPIRINTPFNKL